LTDFKQVLGYRLSGTRHAAGLYIPTVLCLGGAYLLQLIIRSRAGRVLIAVRDSEKRVVFSGYTPATYKLFVFVVAAALAGLAGCCMPQVGIITPAQIGVLPSLEMVIWVAVGGRGSLAGAVLGALSVNYGRSVLTNYFPELWPFILGGLFVLVVLLFPDGLVGMIRKGKSLLSQRKGGEEKGCAGGGAEMTASLPIITLKESLSITISQSPQQPELHCHRNSFAWSSGRTGQGKRLCSMSRGRPAGRRTSFL
jgi:hypothetical protein